MLSISAECSCRQSSPNVLLPTNRYIPWLLRGGCRQWLLVPERRGHCTWHSSCSNSSGDQFVTRLKLGYAAFLDIPDITRISSANLKWNMYMPFILIPPTFQESWRYLPIHLLTVSGISLLDAKELSCWTVMYFDRHSRGVIQAYQHLSVSKIL